MSFLTEEPGFEAALDETLLLWREGTPYNELRAVRALFDDAIARECDINGAVDARALAYDLMQHVIRVHGQLCEQCAPVIDEPLQ